MTLSIDAVETFSPVFNSPKDKIKVSSMINTVEQMMLCVIVFGQSVSILDEEKFNSFF